MNKLIFSTFFCAVVLILSAGDIFACTCMHLIKPVEGAYKQNSAIFSGKVISIKKTDNFFNIIKIKVGKSWKGKLSKTITISTAAAGSMCGYKFVIGKSFLTYADGDNQNNFRVSLCSRTALLSGSKEDIETLNNLLAKDDSKTKSSPK